jgi:hypothetical protein
MSSGYRTVTKRNSQQMIGIFSGYSAGESHYARAVGEIEQPSRSIERVPRHVLAARAAPRYAGDDYSGQDYEEEPGGDWTRQLAALRRHRVTLVSLVLIAASLLWKGVFLSHYFYRQDDFAAFDTGLKSGLSWSFLTHIDSGHMFPGVYLISWVLARAALYNWAAGVTVELVLIAGASVAAWRVLRTLMGNRPALLIPLIFYLFAPLAFPTDSWWITAIEAVPLQIALFMALNSHLHYVWTGRLKHAVASAAWQFFGLFFFEKAVLIPVLLFVVTVGFLTNRRGRAGLRATVVRLWRGWVLYLALAFAYAVVFLAALSNSTVHTGPPSSLHAFDAFASRLIFDTLLPGSLGGPWHWYHTVNSAGAFAAPPSDLSWLSLVVVLAIIAASILTRRRAWRAWTILAGWVVLADMVPVAIGRLGLGEAGYAALFGMETRYVAEVPAVLALAVALAFWPVAGPAQPEEPSSTRRREFFTGYWKPVAIAVVVVFVAGSIWSVHRFQSLTTTFTSAVTPNRIYIANATKALAETPAGTVIVIQKVPSNIMLGIFGEEAEASVVLGPLSHRGSQVTWTTQPSGTIGQLRVFGSDGRLWLAAIRGVNTVPTPGFKGCTTAKRSRLVLPFQLLPASFSDVMRIGYAASPSAAGQTVTVQYGSFTSQFTVLAGNHKVYFPIHGTAGSVALQGQSGVGGLCFAPAVAGLIVGYGSPIPSTGG